MSSLLLQIFCQFCCKYLQNIQLQNYNCVSVWDFLVVYDSFSNIAIATEFTKFCSNRRSHVSCILALGSSFLQREHVLKQVVNSCGLALALGHVGFRGNKMFLVRVNVEFNVLCFSKLKSNV